jgi:hypothetical protein
VVSLTKEQWTRLYKEVAAFAHGVTFTKVEKRKWTNRDRAQEAVQRACLRFLEVKPAAVETYEQARDYLMAAVRSELSHARERWETRKEHEKAAVIEQATTEGASKPSSEGMHLERGEQVREQGRAARIIELTKEYAAGDRLVLGTIDCIEREIVEPADQAKQLECAVEEIYLARKRRVYAVENAIARYERERKAKKEDE